MRPSHRWTRHRRGEGDSLADNLHPDDYTHALKVASVPLHDQAMVEEEACKWKKEWASAEPYLSPLAMSAEELERYRMPPLSASELRASAKSFPAGTALGMDGVQPRAYARLQDAMLDKLAEWLHGCEATGSWGEEAMGVLISLRVTEG